MMRNTRLAAVVATAAIGAVGGAVAVETVPSADAAAGSALASKAEVTKSRTLAIVGIRRANANGSRVRALNGRIGRAEATIGGLSRQIRAQQQQPEAQAPAPAPPVGPVGLDPDKLTLVTGPSVVISADRQLNHTLACPSGIALAGGWFRKAGTSANVRVAGSRPAADLSGWMFRFANPGPGDITVAPYVTCVQA